MFHECIKKKKQLLGWDYGHNEFKDKISIQAKFTNGSNGSCIVIININHAKFIIVWNNYAVYESE